MIPVRRFKSLPTAAFRSHLAVDTLAVQLYTSSLSRRVRDLHPLERAHGAQTKSVDFVVIYALTLLTSYRKYQDFQGVYSFPSKISAIRSQAWPSP